MSYYGMFRSVNTDAQMEFLVHKNQHLKAVDHSPAVAELRGQLMDRVLEVAAEVLTPHQKKVFELWRQIPKLSCREIAEIIGTGTGSAVTKSLYGNALYGPRFPAHRQGTTTGGIFRKLQKATSVDPQCLELLERIAEARNQAAEDEPEGEVG